MNLAVSATGYLYYLPIRMYNDIPDLEIFLEIVWFILVDLSCAQRYLQDVRNKCITVTRIINTINNVLTVAKIINIINIFF